MAGSAVDVNGHLFEVRHGPIGLGDTVRYDDRAVGQRRPFGERIVPFWVMEAGSEIRYEVEISAEVPGRIAAIRRNGREVFAAPPVPLAGDDPDAADGSARTGRFLAVPYDWRTPTLRRIKSRVWNPEDPRLMMPKAFGWGYDLNVHALLRRAGIIRQRRSEPKS